uniref:Secreted protein n=1 Tax=Anopheles darlingi TaxID=43151 RepID=A0A2M4DH78_ANODA
MVMLACLLACLLVAADAAAAAATLNRLRSISSLGFLVAAVVGVRFDRCIVIILRIQIVIVIVEIGHIELWFLSARFRFGLDAVFF